MHNIIKSLLPKDLVLGDFITIQGDVKIGPKTRICSYVNLYGCRIGRECMIGPFVEIQRDVSIGNRTRISSHTFICSKVRIGKNCFIAHGVMFINDNFGNDKVNFDPRLWRQTKVGNNVMIGSNATILPVGIGDNSIIGAGSVVIKDVPDNSVVAGNPARIIRHRNA